MAGALGRMGRESCAAIAAASDMVLVAGLARRHAGEPVSSHVASVPRNALLYDDGAQMCADAQPDVVVDFTTYPDTVRIATTVVERGVAAVVGSTGWTSADRAKLAQACARAGAPACLAPNFALGAVLMMRFAEEAAAHFPTAEIVELHHEGKRDAPSGTARLTAERMHRASGRNVPIHSVRLSGLVAHQEVLLGGTGELLTIRHDSLSRESFMNGMLLAIRRIRHRSGLTEGLDALVFA